MNVCDYLTRRQHFIKNRHCCVVEITAWGQEQFWKPVRSIACFLTAPPKWKLKLSLARQTHKHLLDWGKIGKWCCKSDKWGSPSPSMHCFNPFLFILNSLLSKKPKYHLFSQKKPFLILLFIIQVAFYNWKI